MSKTLIVILSIGLLLAFGAGCSKNSTKHDLVQGDPADPTFLQAKSLAVSYVGNAIGGQVGDALEQLNFSQPKIATDTSYWDFDATTYWHIYYESTVADSPSFYETAIDSFRFKSGADYQDLPDSTTSELSWRMRGSAGQEEGDTTLIETFHDLCDITGIQSDSLKINGNSFIGLDAQAGNIIVTDTISSSLTNFTILKSDVEGEGETHPVAGSLSLLLAIRSTGQIGELPEMNMRWTLTATFTATGYHARFESADNYWEWNQTWAESPAPTSPYPWH